MPAAKEITENSLLNLLVQDLFVQQQDSKEVRDIIQGSEKLQKKMFLVLSETEPELWTIVQRNSKWVFKLIDPNKWTGGDPMATPVTLNPLLKVVLSDPEKVECIRRTWWGKRWHNERVCMIASNQAIDRKCGFLASYVSDPPCVKAVVSIEFRIDWPTPTSRPEAHPHSASARDVTVESKTGLTLGMLLNGALEGAGEFRYKDQYGTIRSQGEPSLRLLLERLENPRIILDLPWEFELVHVLEPTNFDVPANVVVPTAEEWAEVRERGARGK